MFLYFLLINQEKHLYWHYSNIPIIPDQLVACFHWYFDDLSSLMCVNYLQLEVPLSITLICSSLHSFSKDSKQDSGCGARLKVKDYFKGLLH